MKTATRKAPWRKSNPRKRSGTSKKLTPAQKSSARRSAKKAGRPYPNLVDNMRVAATARKRKASGATKRKTATKRKSS